MYISGHHWIYNATFQGAVKGFGGEIEAVYKVKKKQFVFYQLLRWIIFQAKSGNQWKPGLGLSNIIITMVLWYQLNIWCKISRNVMEFSFQEGIVSKFCS